ncbi:similar to aryl hydrocarbon receptor nuclear translocator-like 2, isoform CRA_b, partial [Rattus norvegicus]
MASGESNVSVVKSACSCRGPESGFQHPQTYKCLQLQLQGTCYPLLASMDTPSNTHRHRHKHRHTHMRMRARAHTHTHTHTHTEKNNKINLF